MESRQENFGLGIHPTETAGLVASTNRFNASNPRAFRANGINQPIMPSPNGMSAMDATRQTPNGQLPSPNGMAADTYHQLNPNSYGISLNI